MRFGLNFDSLMREIKLNGWFYESDRECMLVSGVQLGIATFMSCSGLKPNSSS